MSVPAPLALAMGLLVLFLALGNALIPALDVDLWRLTARRAGAGAANDDERAAAREAERYIG